MLSIILQALADHDTSKTCSRTEWGMNHLKRGQKSDYHEKLIRLWTTISPEKTPRLEQNAKDSIFWTNLELDVLRYST